MGKLERLAAARERVRKWKETHPKSLEWQRKRRYARQKSGRIVVMKAKVRSANQAALGYAHYGETHTGDIEGVDIPYAQMEPNKKGGRGRTNTSMGQVDEPGVARADVSGPEPESAEEKANARLAQLQGRQARGELMGQRRGVQIDIEVEG